MIHKHRVAGSFYPNDKKELKAQINKYLDEVDPPQIDGEIKALILPHAGYQYSGPIAAHGFKSIQDTKYDDIFIIGPSHQCEFNNIALTDSTEWTTPLGSVPVSNTSDKMMDNKLFEKMGDPHDMEHSIEVQIPFLQTVLDDFKIIPIATGKITDHQEIAKKIIKFLKKDSLIIVSSDLSHYQYYEDAEEEDKHTIEEITRLENDISHEEACGADGIILLIEIAKLLKWKPQLLDYRHSGDTTEDKKEVVGYASMAFSK